LITLLPFIGVINDDGNILSHAIAITEYHSATVCLIRILFLTVKYV